jgi:hypothetical protein
MMILWGLIIVLNLVRFVGFQVSPPGFYIDEAVGAAHVLCLKQTGHDFNGVVHPLFSAGPGGGFFTAPYVYGQMLWTSVFGDSTAAFRMFAAFVTSLTVLFLTLYVKKKSNSRTALWVALLATVSPWAFQFSRIAWDPPMAPLFVILGLYLLEGRSKFSWLFSATSFAAAAYAYPPTRLQVPLLLILLPGMGWKKTGKIILAFLVLITPVLYQSLDPAFTARTRMLAITSHYPSNPYRDESFLGLAWALIKQTFAHFDPNFLIVSGDVNIRHSTRQFGVMSWLQFLAFVWGLLWVLIDGVRVALKKPATFWSKLSPSEQTLLWLGIVGTFLGIAPAAATWEGVPHAIRSIGAWPFLCILCGVVIERAIRWLETHSQPAIVRVAQNSIWVMAIGFFAIYLNFFFTDYAESAKPWFQVDKTPIAQAYGRMTTQGMTCDEARSR